MGLGDGLTNKLQLNYRVSCCDICTSAIRFLPVVVIFTVASLYVQIAEMPDISFYHEPRIGRKWLMFN